MSRFPPATHEIPPQECFRANGVSAVSGTNGYYTKAFNIFRAPGAGFQTFSRGGAGQWVPYISNVPSPVLTTDDDWTDVTDFIEPAIAAVVAGSPLSQWIPLGGIEAAWCRLKWVNATDTDVPEAFFAAKQTT
jgi:hypothetical protein